jgi:RNA polymerase sigma factor (sigma-70 family)
MDLGKPTGLATIRPGSDEFAPARCQTHQPAKPEPKSTKKIFLNPLVGTLILFPAVYLRGIRLIVAGTDRSRVGVMRSLLDDLARRYYAPLSSYFRKRTRNSAEAQDLVQQVFLRLAQYPELTDLRDRDAYIFQTAANALRDHYRRQAVRARFTDEHSAFLAATDSDFSPDRVLQGREEIARLVGALRNLSERTRDIIMLRCFEGLKHSEIARLHGISTRAVEKHVAKGLAYLSGVLDRGDEE